MMRKKFLLAIALGLMLIFLLVSGLAMAPVLHAVTNYAGTQPSGNNGPLAQVVITPIKDNTLYENTNGTTSNGIGTFFFVGKTSGNSTRRGLLAFDLTSKVPAGATIVSATLHLQMSRTSAGVMSIGLHRALANWGEGTSDASANEGKGGDATTGDATWLHTFHNTATWLTAGGDFVPTATVTIPVNDVGLYQWSSPGLLADVQAWVANPTSNFGWVVVGDESTAGTAKRFSSRESTTAANRPQLTIVYTGGEVVTQAIYLPLVRN